MKSSRGETEGGTPRYRRELPQLSGDIFITDAGLETTLIFHQGLELPEFAAIVLVESEAGREALRTYFRTYAELAQRYGVGCIIDSPTWRASSAWGAKLGYSASRLAELNRRSVELVGQVRRELEGDGPPIVISGCLGPPADAYDPAPIMSALEAEQYHLEQITIFGESEADMAAAMTLTHVAEAVGIVRAAASVGIPVVLSFTVETDGRLATGQQLGEAIEAVDRATGGGPAYYMINCAHPTHFSSVLDVEAPWRERIRGIRANASTMSHAELDQAEVLDEGDPAELGRQYGELRRGMSHLNVLGGCCGTDHRHIEEILETCLATAAGNGESRPGLTS